MNTESCATDQAPFGALLLCGGKGTRLESITHDKRPKSLVEVGGKSLLQHSTDLLRSQKIGNLYLLVAHHADQIEAWAAVNMDPDKTVFVEQTEPGVRGALLAGLLAMKESTAIIMNTDELRVGCDMEAAIGAHTQKPEAAHMLASRERDLYRHRVLHTNEDGVVIGSELKSGRFVDDFDTYGLVNAGMTIMPRTAIDLIDEREGNDWNSLIQPLVGSDMLMMHHQPNMRYFNVGTPQEYDEATRYIAEHTLPMPA